MRIQKINNNNNQKTNNQIAFGLNLTIKPVTSGTKIEKYISTEEINKLVDFFKNKGLKSDYADLKIGHSLMEQPSGASYKITGDMAIFSEPIGLDIERESHDKAYDVIKDLISEFLNS